MRPGAVLRFVGLFLTLVGLLGHFYWAISGGLVREGHWVGMDFHVYYQAALVLRRGEDIYHAGISPLYVYPPTLAVLVVPLSFLQADHATILWKLSQYACLMLAGVLLVNLLPPRARPLVGGLLMLGWLTSPFRDEVHFGESNSLVLALVVGSVWLIARTQSEQPARIRLSLALAGFLLALAVSIKVLPVLLVALLWWRGPRVVAAAATGGFALLQLLTLAVVPATAYYWLVEFPGLFGQAFPFPDNQSLNAVIARALLPTDPTQPPTQLADGAAVRPVLTWAANLTVLAAAAWVLWSSRRVTTAHDYAGRNIGLLLQVGLVLLTTHLVSGSTWVHHLVALSVPITGLVGAWWLAWSDWSTHRCLPTSDTPAHAAGDGHPEGRLKGSEAGTVGLALLLGGAYGLLLWRPSEWWAVAGQLAYGNALLALIASSMATWVVIALWLAVAFTLRRMGRVGSTPNNGG